MKRYDGDPKDVSYGGGSWEGKHDILNFARAKDGFFYGFVQPPNKGIRLSGLSKVFKILPDKNCVENVLIVWVAPDSEDNGRKIVGWYDNATIYIDMRSRKVDNSKLKKLWYFAKSKNAHLIPEKERNFKIPVHGRGLNYLGDRSYEVLKKDILQYVYQGKIPKRYLSIRNSRIEETEKDIEEQEEIADKVGGLKREEIIKKLGSISQNNLEYIEIRGKVYKRNNLRSYLVKNLRDFKCQICKKSILKKDGSRYIEAAHIDPKRDGGSEAPENLLILCPNHHKEFDLGRLKIINRTNKKIIFELNGKRHNICLDIKA